ncbi:hypothetical protein SAMN04490208_0275 [Pseudomonas poae]|uniref:Uncharacterized protein n=1 Tax=Pseudomonas poae TaxID=200451 RepID=A0ABY0RAN4_9PSED|nr:hypothetical protein SAMN04490208_0273 [Pseudomonas poae]SDN42316.1 hypothetical protein SAMN04490208_0275 [Pseudomonas poae]
MDANINTAKGNAISFFITLSTINYQDGLFGQKTLKNDARIINPNMPDAS